MTIRVGISGIQEAQNANAKAIAAMRPSGAFGRAIRDATAEGHRYAVSITHVWNRGENPRGGGLKASHRMAVTETRGQVFIDPHSVNPRGQKPSVYGPHEHARGGSHAFYERTERERGPRIAARALETIRSGLP